MGVLVRLFLIILLCIPSLSWAACGGSGNALVVASPYAASDVNDCVTAAAALSGVVTITIPATTGAVPTWTEAVVVDMSDESDPAPNWTNVTSLTIQGESQAGTVINNPRFTITTESDKKFIAKDMSFTGTSQARNANIFQIYGDTTVSSGGGFRIANLNINMSHVDSPSTHVVVVDNNNSSGVIDGNTIVFDLQAFNVGGSGYIPWTEDDPFGTDNAVYIEGNTLTNTESFPKMACDLTEGGRQVLRWNTLTNYYFGGHDYQGNNAGRSFEIYNNYTTSTFTNSNVIWSNLRGGTGYVYNNKLATTVANAPTNHALLQNYRSQGIVEPYCDATPEKRCFMDDYNYDDDTCTTDADCNNEAGACQQVDTQEGGEGEEGWACRDQIGRGKNQALRPMLWWNNTGSYAGADYVSISPVSVASAHIKVDRDYCLHDTSTTCNGVASIYTAYTCPHPLTGNIGSCDPSTAGRGGYHLGNANFSSGASHSFFGGATHVFQ